MPKIIILSYDYPPNDGGISRLCFEIKKQLELNNHSVQVVCLQAKGTDLENDRNVVRLPSKRIQVEWEMLKYLRRHTSKDDIVLADTYHPSGLLAYLAGRKFYVLAHGAELLSGNSFFRKVLWNYYRKWILAKADFVIANSHYTEGLVRHCSPGAKVVAIPLAVDENYFHPVAKKKNNGMLNLCSLSRLHKFKGHDFILKTVAALPEHYRKMIRLKIGGKGPYKLELEKLANELGLTDQVTFVGFVAEGELCTFYSESDIFILCTREEPENRNVEGFGLVFTEAQACGTAVIGTRAGGIPDAVDEGDGGWLIKPDSMNELCTLLMELIDTPGLAANEGKKARRRIEEEGTWNMYYKKLARVISL